MEALQEALLSGGSPMTVVDLQKSLINHANKLTLGKILNQVWSRDIVGNVSTLGNP